MKLLPLSKNGLTATARPTTLTRPPSWPWQTYCHQPKTLSFRGGDDLFRSMNSAYLEAPEEEGEEEGCEDGSNDDCIENVIRGARSECRGRLFFEPAGETSSVLAVESEEDGASEEEQHAREELGDDGVAVCVVESRNPYRDFRTSMEEMVEAHALRGNWDSLEELLRCYLRVNDRTNHAYIFGAFVDLLLGSDCRRTRPFTDGSACSYNRNNNVGSSSGNSINPPSTSSPCSPLSFYTSPCSSSNSLSTTPCCISTTGEAEDSSSSSSSVTVTIEQRQQRLPLSLKAAAEQDRLEGDESSSSASSSSSDVRD